MDAAEARALLGVFRPGVDDAADPRFAEALALTRRDPELARWWEQEQALDAVLTAKLRAAPVPPDLRGELLALGKVVTPPDTWQRTWRPVLAGGAIAAALTWLAALLLLHAPRPTPSGSVAKGEPSPTATPVLPGAAPESLTHFRQEMVSFVQLPPPLEFESHDPDKLRDYLKRKDEGMEINPPAGLRALPGMGCRTLSFRGYPVALVCFQRKNGQLIHLLVVDRKALAAFAGTREQPLVGPEGAWETAAWTEGEFVYFVAVKGDAEVLNAYLKPI